MIMCKEELYELFLGGNKVDGLPPVSSLRAPRVILQELRASLISRILRNLYYKSDFFEKRNNNEIVVLKESGFWKNKMRCRQGPF